MALQILRNDNYESWSACLREYLLAHNLWNIVETASEAPKPEDGVVEFEVWRGKNDAALEAIRTLCGTDVLSQIKGISSAKIAWHSLAELYGQTSQEIYPMVEVGSSSNVTVSKQVRPTPTGDIQRLGEQGNSSNNTGRDDNVAENHDQYSDYAPLLKAVQSGNLKAVQDFLKLHPEATVAKVTWRNETALHIAVIAEKTHIIEELVKVMSPKDLETRDRFGYTALARAATTEDYRLAECMIRKNPMLVSIPDDGPGYIPLNTATNFGNKEMARYLYSCTPLQDLEPEKGCNGASLIAEAIFAEYFDIALDLIERCPRLARTQDRYNKSPLFALALMQKAFPSGIRLVFWKQWIYNYCIHIESGRATKDVRLYIPNDQGGRVRSVGALTCQLLTSHLLNFLGFKQLHDMKLRHVQSHQLLSRIYEEISTFSHEDMIEYSIYDAFFQAAKNGIFELCFEMMRRNPILVQVPDSDGQRIFMKAVLNRQAEIFSLIYGLKQKKFAVAGQDRFSHNNILHMAGVLTASTPLNHIPGAALQMQRELQWFKEVESIVSPGAKIMQNNDKLTPKQLFSLSHEDLRKKGEEWMQSTATSCTVVGSLIITIMFAVAFTVPGGNDQNTGFPIFSSKKLFVLFMIFDSISLFSSSASVLIFLGVLTSRYAEEDFLESLPKKLIIGLCTLFFSIATMMITFSFALLLILRGRLWISISIISLASIPVTLFVLMQFPLLVDMLKATYGPGIFNRNMKSWL